MGYINFITSVPSCVTLTFKGPLIEATANAKVTMPASRKQEFLSIAYGIAMSNPDISSHALHRAAQKGTAFVVGGSARARFPFETGGFVIIGFGCISDLATWRGTGS